jgi:beta-N-acetylhexosaminidase
LILLFFSFYWYWETKRSGITPVEEIPPPKEIIKKPEIIIPASLIPVIETKTFEISKLEEIPKIFEGFLKEELPEGSFTRIIIKNLTENRLVSLKELSQVFQIEVPAEIFQKLEGDFTLAIYSQKEGKRMVLVGKVKEKEKLLKIFENWEKKIEKEGLTISGKKVPTLASSFKTKSYQGIDFRYLTISKLDLGICYAWFEDYFILATSFESMEKTIAAIKNEELIKKMGQLFIVGFQGKNLTQELEGFFKKYRPGGILLLPENIENKEQLKKLISDLQNLSLKETGLPLFIAVDQEGGAISRIEFLKEKTPQSEIKNIEEAYQIGLKRGEELKELGINLNLAPVLDLANKEDFIFKRTFQKGSQEIGELAKSLVLGQKRAGILTCIKHFPGYGKIPFNPEEELASLEKIPEISQFKKVREANPEMVMTSNAIYKEIDPYLPFTFSPKGIQFLKTNLGSEILIISDDLDQNSLLNKFLLREMIKRPIEAGVDILIFSGLRSSTEKTLNTFFEMLMNKEISQEKIDNAISKVVNLKQKMLK